MVGGWMCGPLVSVWMALCGGLVCGLCGGLGWVRGVCVGWGGLVCDLCVGSDGVWWCVVCGVGCVWRVCGVWVVCGWCGVWSGLVISRESGAGGGVVCVWGIGWRVVCGLGWCVLCVVGGWAVTRAVLLRGHATR